VLSKNKALIGNGTNLLYSSTAPAAWTEACWTHAYIIQNILALRGMVTNDKYYQS